jgi:hypothetical protein
MHEFLFIFELDDSGTFYGENVHSLNLYVGDAIKYVT